MVYIIVTDIIVLNFQLHNNVLSLAPSYWLILLHSVNINLIQIHVLQ